MPGPRNALGDDVETRRMPSRDDATPGAFNLLVVRAGGVEVHPLPATGSVTLGRLRENHIVIDDASISRRHAAIELGATALRVRDLGSANGVFVRRERVPTDGVVEVTVGEVVELGAVAVLVQHRGAGAIASRVTTVVRDADGVGRATMMPPPRRERAGASVGSGHDAVAARDPAMRRLHELIARVADSTLSVLIAGETGVGKEVLAEAVHRASPRAGAPFVRLNCAALSPTLLESELFGHEKGAFTGADTAKPGLLETAEGGTVFLDEIGELPMLLQVKLLRVLEERSVMRVGGLRPRAIDVRFVAATNRDLRREVAAGTFRRDIYFRLGGVTLEVPPLRDRPVDLEALADAFAQRAGRGAATGFTADARAAMAGYDWPGNVRELRNVVERAVLVAGPGRAVDVEHLPAEVAAALPGAPPAPRDTAIEGTSGANGVLRSELQNLERQRILDALAKHGDNQTRAAEALGIPRRTFVARLKAYNIPGPRGGRSGG